MFAGQARGPVKCSSWVGLSLARKYEFSVEGTESDKHSSLLQYIINYKSFTVQAHRLNFIKFSLSPCTCGQNKPEHLFVSCNSDVC